MAMVTTQPLSFDTNNHLRDASFSSYLNSSEKTIISKLAENPNSLFLGKKKVGEGEGEIGVFCAEKYFNDLVVEENPGVSNNVTRIKTQYPKNAPIDISHLKSKIQPRTPSAYSESSWNSQSGLLQSVKRNPSQRKGKNFISSLGCSCSCNVKNSIEINERDEETNSKKSLGCGEFDGKMGKNEITQKGSDPVDLTRINQSGLNPWVMEEIHCKKIEEMGNGLNREDCFSFPILNSNPGGKSNPLNFQENQDEKHRNSLEVFGSSVLNTKNKNFLILESNPAMWGWQADSVAEEFFDNSRYTGQLTNSGYPDKLTNSGCPGQLTHVVEEFGIPQSFDVMYNDNESEGSSDLFEIESFTNSGNSFPKRNGSDGMSTCVTPTTCYAPSEVSIEWSVVTASAAEFSSVISDSEEFVNSEGIRNPRKTGPDGKTSSVGGKEMENRRSGNLLSCKNYKAVRVAGDAYMRSGKGNFDSRRGHNKSSRDGKGK